MHSWKHFVKGIFSQNPTFGLVLGLCPPLAITTSMDNALGMGLSTTFVLCGSSLIISLVRRAIPGPVRLPCFIVIIATFVTIVEQLLEAYAPALNAALGVFVPLIVVNCIILGRAEAFACKEPPGPSLLDALGMGAGFTLSLAAIAFIREALGAGRIFGRVFAPGFEPSLMVGMAPGALLTLGLLFALRNWLQARRKNGGE